MSVEGGGICPSLNSQRPPRGTQRNARNNSRSNLSQIPHQILVGNCFNLHSDLCVKSCDNQFHLLLNASSP